MKLTIVVQTWILVSVVVNSSSRTYASTVKDEVSEVPLIPTRYKWSKPTNLTKP